MPIGPQQRIAAADGLQVALLEVGQTGQSGGEVQFPIRKLGLQLGEARLLALEFFLSPLLQGSPNAWASGIVRAVGGANFLHDKSQTPYMRATDIDHYLGTSPSSGAAKLAAIRKMLKIHPMDHH